MTLMTNTFEAVGADEAVITTGNSGGASGNAFSTVVGSPVVDTAVAMHGTFSMRTLTGATANYVSWTGLSTSDIALRGYFYFTAATTADYSMMRVYNATTNVFSVGVNSASKIRLFGQSSTIGTFLTAIPLNQWIRVEIRATPSATAGVVSCAYYLGDSTTPVETAISSTTANTGATAFTEVRFGKNATTGLDAHWVDDIAVQTAAAGAFIGPSVSTTSASYTSITSSTGWTATGGTVLACLSDASDATLITSSANPTAVLVDGVLGPLAVPAGDLTVQVRMDKENATSGTLTAKLYDGATLRATVSGVAIPDPISTVNVTFLAANITAVTSWASGVRMTLEVTAA